MHAVLPKREICCQTQRLAMLKLRSQLRGQGRMHADILSRSQIMP